MKSGVTYLLAFLLFFASCEKDEIPVEPHPEGDVTLRQVSIGNYYGDQVWYSLEHGEEVSRNKRTSWDLAFECNEPGWRITLNSANNPRLAATGQTDILAVTDTAGMDFKWDEFSGNLDSTAMGDWRVTEQIYVINRGKDEFGKALGIMKIVVDSVSDSTFFFRYAGFNDSLWTNQEISKQPDYFFSYFSFKAGGEQVQVAPPTADWDIVFTQYTFVFYDMMPIVPYLVSGVTLNPNDPYSAKEFSKPFTDISRDDIISSNFNERTDNIGYDWKYYDFGEMYYVTLPAKSYIVRAQSQKMYKIHFLDWYNEDTGEKGNASFEYSEL